MVFNFLMAILRIPEQYRENVRFVFLGLFCLALGIPCLMAGSHGLGGCLTVLGAALITYTFTRLRSANY